MCWCLCLKCSKNHLRASSIPKFFRGDTPRKRGRGQKGREWRRVSAASWSMCPSARIWWLQRWRARPSSSRSQACSHPWLQLDFVSEWQYGPDHINTACGRDPPSLSIWVLVTNKSASILARLRSCPVARNRRDTSSTHSETGWKIHGRSAARWTGWAMAYTQYLLGEPQCIWPRQ